MLKDKIFELTVGIIVGSLILFYTMRANKVTTIESDRKCCTIQIDNASKVVTYTETNGSTIRTKIGEDDLDQIVDRYQEFCYKNH